MSDIFTPADVTNENGDQLKSLADRFGVQITPETEKILRAKAEADAFIEQMKKENQELRQEVTAKITMDELLTQIRNQSNQPVQPQPSVDPNPQVKQIDTPDIEKIVAEHLKKATTESQRAKNLDEVTKKLSEKFGADAQLNLNKKAQELGVSIEYLREQAAQNPAVFYRLVDLDRPTNVQSPLPAPRGSVQAPQVSGVRDAAWYAKLKAEDPKRYFSQEMTVQQYRDRMEAAKRGTPW